MASDRTPEALIRDEDKGRLAHLQPATQCLNMWLRWAGRSRPPTRPTEIVLDTHGFVATSAGHLKRIHAVLLGLAWQRWRLASLR